MKRLEWFYLISTAFGFFVNILTFISFYLQIDVSQFRAEETTHIWAAIVSILTLFYTNFAITSWAYWRWLPAYTTTLKAFNEKYEEWYIAKEKWKKENPPRYLNQYERYEDEEARGVIKVHNYPKFPIPRPSYPKGFGKKGRLLTVGLGILTYPFAAMWGLTFAPEIIWSATNSQFILILLAPFALSGLAVFTAVIIVNGIQDYIEV